MRIHIAIALDFVSHSIVGVFSTKEKADLFAANNPVGGNAVCLVEEWILDEREHYVSKTIWHCGIDIETGAVVSQRAYTGSCGTQYTKTGKGTVTVWADSSVSEKHARELAVGKLQEVLRAERF